MLHLAKITKIHEDDAFFQDTDVKCGEIILWITREITDGWEEGHALRKDGHQVVFFAIKTKRLN